MPIFNECIIAKNVMQWRIGRWGNTYDIRYGRIYGRILGVAWMEKSASW